MDPKGTARLRETLAASRSCHWLTITTWNDYGETTQVEPGVGFGVGRLDLIRSLLSDWRGSTPWPADASRIYVTHPNEVQAGTPFAAEVVALLPPGNTAPAVTLGLESAAGALLSTQKMVLG